MVRELLKRGAKVEVFDKEGNCPISYAVSKGLLPIAKLLLEAKAGPNHMIRERSFEYTPICVAAHQRNPEMLELLELLLTYGAAYDISKNGLLDLDDDCSNETFLERAGRLACIEVLLRRSQPQTLEKKWWESVAVNQLLLKYGMKIDWETVSPKFARLCSSVKPEVIDFLLSQNKILPALLDAALVEAVNAYRSEVIKLLLAAGAKADRPLTDGRMALDEAQRGNAAALKILLEAGKYAKPELNQALRLAIRDANSMECVELLLAVGAEVNVPDRDGYTAFSMAAGVSSGDINDKSNTKSLSNIYNI